MAIDLARKGDFDEALAVCREAVRVNPGFLFTYNNLGDELRKFGPPDEAVAILREALRVKSDYAIAHCNLGLTLEKKGEFAAALVSLRHGHELGSKFPRWPYPSAAWIRACERHLELDGRLPAVLHGERTPASPAERLEFAELCALKQLSAAGARFYQEVFADKPELAHNFEAGHRYNAACAAALAGSGRGQDAASLDEGKRVAWRRQALEWLSADLSHWAEQAESKSLDSRIVVMRTLEHWHDDPDLAGVRGQAVLAKLPEAERQDWRKLWADVESTLALARGQGSRAERSQEKP